MTEAPNRTQELRLLEQVFAVARLDPGDSVPKWLDGEVTCVARTPKELSVLGAEAAFPADVQSSGGWRCFEVAGPLEFSEIGILSALTAVLATAEVSVFVFSTFDTDYLLVQADKLDRTTAALERAGHRVVRP